MAVMAVEVVGYIVFLFQQAQPDNTLLIATVIAGAVVSIATLLITTWGQIRTSEIKAKLDKQESETTKISAKVEKQAATTDVIHALVNNQHALDLASIARLQGMVDTLLATENDKQKAEQSLAAFRAGQEHTGLSAQTVPGQPAPEIPKVEVVNTEPVPVDVVVKLE